MELGANWAQLDGKGFATTPLCHDPLCTTPQHFLTDEDRVVVRAQNSVAGETVDAVDVFTLNGPEPRPALMTASRSGASRTAAGERLPRLAWLRRDPETVRCADRGGAGGRPRCDEQQVGAEVLCTVGALGEMDPIDGFDRVVNHAVRPTRDVRQSGLGVCRGTALQPVRSSWDADILPAGLEANPGDRDRERMTELDLAWQADLDRIPSRLGHANRERRKDR